MSQEQRGQQQAPKIERPAARHNHVTRDVKPRGVCPACDLTHEYADSVMPAAEVPQQPRTLINRWHNRGGRVIE